MSQSQATVRDFSHDKKESDKYLPAFQNIVALVFSSIAPDDIDQQEATDLYSLQLESPKNRLRIGCRTRDYEGFGLPDCPFRYDFTIRYDRPSGRETEFSKLQKGLCDYIIYGFADCIEVTKKWRGKEQTESVGHLIRWIVVDVEAFLNCLEDLGIVDEDGFLKLDDIKKRKFPGIHFCRNKDNSSDFLAFDTRVLTSTHPEIIYASFRW